MSKQAISADAYYVSRAPHLLKGFDRRSKNMRAVLKNRFREDFVELVLKDARQEFEQLLPSLPYVGGDGNRFTPVLVQSAECLTLHRALKRQGKDVYETGVILWEFMNENISRMSWLGKLRLRLTWVLVFTPFGKMYVRSLARRTEKRRYAGDWHYRYVGNDGSGFDFGLDCGECAVHKLLKKLGEEEVAKYVCLFEYPYSRLAGSGLARSTAVANGDEKCDLRFKRGRHVRDGWPPDFPIGPPATGKSARA